MKNVIIIAVIIAGAFIAYQKVLKTSADESLVFTLDNCKLCEIAIQLLDERELDYTEYNVNESDENFDLFKKHKGRSLPLLIIDGERIEPRDETFLNIAINGLFESDNREVVVYTETGCGWCVKTIAFFQDNDIEFTEYNVRESDDFHDRFKALGGRGVPLVIIGDNQIGGYNIKAFRMALEQIDLM